MSERTEEIVRTPTDKGKSFGTASADPATAHERLLTGTRGRGVIGGFIAVLLLSAIAYGPVVRSSDQKKLSRATEDASVLSVSVVHPNAGSASEDLVLPGSVQAFTDTPIYSRTNGYLKKWYFDIGSRVRKGQLLAEIETPEVDQQLNQAQAELQRMRSNEQLAQITSDRWQALLTKHAVSQQDADQARSNLISAQAGMDASEANVHRLEQLKSYERIVAPFDGVITARNTDIGDLIDAGAGSSSPRELFHLAAVNKLRVYVAVPERESNSVHNGDAVFLTEDANPGMKIPGTIVRNADAIDQTTRTLNVEVDVSNTAGALRPGAYVFVHFHLSARGHTVTLPSNALLFRAEGLRVGIVRRDRVQLVPVTIGHDFGGSVEITSGITADDAVILNPPDWLTTGAEVHPQFARNQQGQS
jgi:RND family efflux transporter MFP subunit